MTATGYVNKLANLARGIIETGATGATVAPLVAGGICTIATGSVACTATAGLLVILAGASGIKLYQEWANKTQIDQLAQKIEQLREQPNNELQSLQALAAELGIDDPQVECETSPLALLAKILQTPVDHELGAIFDGDAHSPLTVTQYIMDHSDRFARLPGQVRVQITTLRAIYESLQQLKKNLLNEYRQTQNRILQAV
ncbi:MAG: hypothetical protein CMJ19_10005 [Phycisphaeraceae bacterium]|nr:hypothetical protein [Phycisphaeraceae bacterium]